MLFRSGKRKVVQLVVTASAPKAARGALTFLSTPKEQVLSIGSVVQRWKPSTDPKDLPTNPDVDKLLFGDLGGVMSMECSSFEDLPRLNEQYKVGIRYATLLRESAGLEFGNKFLRNLEIVQGFLDQVLAETGKKMVSPLIH